jgi:hypothetical protein
MILNKRIIEDIKNESGLLFDKAGDFALLAGLVYKKTKRNIGVTTLKRLFCYINDDRKASEYTLNTIALYLGFSTWDEYTALQKIESDWGFEDESIYIQALDPGTQLTIKYLNRKVIFLVKELDGNNVLEVSAVENGSLQVGDILHVHKIKKGSILEAESVLRGTSHGNYKTNGEINFIEIIEA